MLVDVQLRLVHSQTEYEYANLIDVNYMPTLKFQYIDYFGI